LKGRDCFFVQIPVLSATIHADIKQILVSISKRTGMIVSQVADEVLSTCLIEIQELDAFRLINSEMSRNRPHPHKVPFLFLHREVSQSWLLS
jgi:hypothetical protein